jgi:hypothetical protein
MASTTFSGPVTSTNGFIGAVTGAVVGNVAGTLTSTTSTSAALGAIGNAVNTANKALGTTLYNTTTKTFYVAQGALAASTWIDSSDGTTTITPA